MKPQAYLDIETRGASSTGGGRITALPVVNRIVRILHGIFRTQPCRFAIAFPRMRSGEARHPGHIVRVFAESRDDLDGVAKELQSNERLRGYVRYEKIKEVPDGFQGPWKEYRRYRIPGTGSRLDRCRQYRLAASEKLPHFRLASKQTGQEFVIFVECRDGIAPGDCQPDSYGLSVPTRAFTLPVVP